MPDVAGTGRAQDEGMSTDTTTPPPQYERRGYPPLTDLRRSRTDRHIAGVSGGLGRYAGIDPLIVRILFVVLTIFGGSGILFYALGWLLVPEEGESESEGQRIMNGRSTRSKGSILALIIVVIAGVVAIGATIDSGPGVGGLGLLAVVGLGAVLLLRNGHRDHPPVQGPVHGPVPPPAEPGAYGQTPGTAYSAAAPPAPASAPVAAQAAASPPPQAAASPPPQTASFTPPAQTATFTPPPPPIGPTYPVYTPPPVPPAPPKERSVLGRVTLSVALVVVGLLIGWNAATDSDVPARVVVAAALGVIGAGLVVGAFIGRARGLVVWGVILTALASIAAFVPDVPMDGGVGDRTWRPGTVADLRSTYELGIGDAELDLSQLDLSTADVQRVEVRQGVGDLTIVVPDDVVVRIDADVQGGDLRVPTLEPMDGTDLHERVVVPEGSSAGSAVLVVDAELGLGSLEVRRAAS
jgi:phage shock protein PspC (stress-responsive transcriptional regulator)